MDQPSETMPNVAVLFTTHLINNQVRTHFEKMQRELPHGYDLFLFFDERRLSERAASKLAGSHLLPHGGDIWRQHKSPCRHFPDKVPGNEDGLIFSAICRLKGYRLYWYVEYDVAFSGDWNIFFKATEASNADLLAVNMVRRDAITDWPNWKSMRPPEGKVLADAQWIRAHLAITRISKRLADVLGPVYQQGWAGHSEGLLATLAEQNGLRVEDIGGDGEFVPPGNKNRFYRSTPTNNSLGPGTFVFRPSIPAPGAEPNMLWHPVKKPSRLDWDHKSSFLARIIDRLFKRIQSVIRDTR